MKKTLFFLLFFCFSILKGYCQLERTTTQAGITVLPIFDVLNSAPDNKISGIILSGNVGYLTLKNVSVGINPFYASGTNSYISSSNGNKETQNLKLYGLNTFFRYYFITKEKFLVYSCASVGFGNLEQRITNFGSLPFAKNNLTDKSVFDFLIGIGGDYFIMKNFALELNINYLNLKYISVDPNDTRFETVVPSVGIQFFWR